MTTQAELSLTPSLPVSLSSVTPSETPQPQRIAHHAQRAQHRGCACEDRIQQSQSGQRNRGCVVEAREALLLGEPLRLATVAGGVAVVLGAGAATRVRMAPARSPHDGKVRGKSSSVQEAK